MKVSNTTTKKDGVLLRFLQFGTKESTMRLAVLIAVVGAVVIALVGVVLFTVYGINWLSNLSDIIKWLVASAFGGKAAQSWTETNRSLPSEEPASATSDTPTQLYTPSTIPEVIAHSDTSATPDTHGTPSHVTGEETEEPTVHS